MGRVFEGEYVGSEERVEEGNSKISLCHATQACEDGGEHYRFRTVTVLQWRSFKSRNKKTRAIFLTLFIIRNKIIEALALLSLIFFSSPNSLEKQAYCAQSRFT